MRIVITLVVSLQIALLAFLFGQRLLNRKSRKANAERRLLINRYSPDDQLRTRGELREEDSGRSKLITSFLGTRYGLWLKQMCLRAGIWNSQQVRKIIGRKLELGLAGIILAFLLLETSNTPIWLLLLIPPIAFMAPDYSIYRRGLKRGELIARSLPETIDLLNMTVSAGLGFQAGIDRISRNGNNPLSDEFRRVLAEIRLGDSRSHAFTTMAERINRPEVWNFTNAISQVEKLGIPITSALRDQATTIRAERREKAREQAQKLPVKILAPIMVFLLPAVLTIVLAPAVLSMLRIF